MVERLQVPAGSMIVSAARHLASRQVSLADLQVLSRYESRSIVAANVDRHVELGFLERVAEDLFVPSPAFREGAILVLDLQAQSARELWSDKQDLVVELAGLAAHLVQRAVADRPVATPAFDGQVTRHSVVPRAHFGQLLGYITELRYLRSDLHAAALLVHDLAGPRARALHRLWRGVAISDADGERLEGRGLAQRSDEQWVITARGSNACDEAERDTNKLTDDAFSHVDAADLERFHAGLAALPGEDPRPVEDR